MSKLINMSGLKTLLEPLVHLINKKAERPDWNENDPSSPDYIENRPFYTESKSDYLVEQQEIVIDDGLTANLTANATFVVGETYTVVIDGVEYQCVAWQGSDGICIGNGDIYGGEGLGGDEPFSCDSYDDGSMYLNTLESGTYTISIAGLSEKVYVIDYKYLPEMVGIKGPVAGAEIFNADVNIANGNYSHAEGIMTEAYGYASHAEGEETEATGRASHAEGQETQATGYASHAEGAYTVATTQGAHAEGVSTKAYGLTSHSEGFNTIAKSQYQHVQGKYNIEDGASTYAHIVGNGSSTSRSNAHTLDWDGNAWYAGTIKVGGTGQNDSAAQEVALKRDIQAITASSLGATGHGADEYIQGLHIGTSASATPYIYSSDGNDINFTYKTSDGSTWYTSVDKLMHPANIEMKPSSSANHGGFIDFHYNGSTADYTSRIIESSSGTLRAYADFTVTGDFIYNNGDRPMKRGSYERIQGTADAHKNLNDYGVAGFYNVKTAYVDNCPSDITCSDAVLLVYPWNTSGWVLQELTETSYTSKRWIRCSKTADNSAWGEWQKVYTTESKPTCAEIGAATSGHTHERLYSGDAQVLTYGTDTRIGLRAYHSTRNHSLYVYSDDTTNGAFKFITYDGSSSNKYGTVYTTLNKPTYSDVGAAAASHNHGIISYGASSIVIGDYTGNVPLMTARYNSNASFALQQATAGSNNVTLHTYSSTGAWQMGGTIWTANHLSFSLNAATGVLTITHNTNP